MNETLDYYDKNAESYASGTADIEFSEIQELFLSELKDGAAILDFDEQDKYDIWACSSILHLPKQELKNVLLHMEEALHNNGIIYTSFKYGDFSGMRNGRFFTNFTEDTFMAFISEVEQLVVEKLWITSDVRPGRQDEKWLNMILRATRR